MLASADRGYAKHSTFELFDGAIFGSSHKPVEGAAKGHGNHPERRTPLNSSDRASDGSLSIQLARDASGDGRTGIHLDELRLQSLFTVKAFFLPEKNIRVIDAAACIGNPDFL